mmetsp:Transcript_21822/g.49693  ORF Transcript_21822/g.49693 Transcript_21822/m.49693 type:complete len:96 (-) Transcript_21822:482-769(-)
MHHQDELGHGAELGAHSAQEADANVAKLVDTGLEHHDLSAAVDRMGDVDPVKVAACRLGSVAVLQEGLGSKAHKPGGAAQVVEAKRDVAAVVACA